MVIDHNVPNELNGGHIPRLAFPGLWWRATGLALVVCGASPDRIGPIAWNEHPTLKALIKMVTSDRYRFPTVDCDDAWRDEMKKTEQEMRDEEAKITELLFLPPRKPTTMSKESENIENSFGGSRASRRQQEKRERMLKKQKEKEAHEALKEANRRRKMLRAAQKSIMLWDPRKGPRKPPKESADLIFSVGELFDLPRKFQRTTNPDFLLMTIGNTTRGAIERAYDWLIPIISFVPETIVRLPASASCFLLLRAYGTEGEERAQLQELSAPLLAHVRQSLTGSFGESDSVRAFDLLLTDVASHNADRRRCARRVLYEAIGKGFDGSLPEPFSRSNCGWMINLLHVQHSSLVVGGAIRYMSRAASFERGRVLRFLILALEKLTKYATNEKILDGYQFPSVLVDLVSSRPMVFASTMGSFPDLRSLAIGVVNGEFRKYTGFGKDEKVDAVSTETMKDACDIVLCCRPSGDDCDEATKVRLPLALLESSCVLLSIWLENAKAAEDSRAVESLVRMLMRTNGSDGSGDDDDVNGLASARLSASGKSAIPVESVSVAKLLRSIMSTVYAWSILPLSRFHPAVGNAGAIQK
jgi:integrator complex subunit 1